MFEQDVPISPFQREIALHQDRQRLSLDASSLLSRATAWSPPPLSASSRPTAGALLHLSVHTLCPSHPAVQ